MADKETRIQEISYLVNKMGLIITCAPACLRQSDRNKAEFPDSCI
ncbi:hypothetical protein SAMN00777080_2533 [Aquiflexum balticum DSM 16537]|uniref:Uncharacterized protein n=1 Tax=Aquiflexum balticum DSM 16537 TaxID=758820 RepID=A0A1W2H4N8_9BACT|nr:hypothetical protein SAMN00777080_2533 [Aquiflexum balticum DSM 16537]